MSELNFSILRENIHHLMEKHNLTQESLGLIAGMSQSNVSQALNPSTSKQFTLEQVFRIADHFKISIDELVGNNTKNIASTSPRAMLSLLSQLLCSYDLKCTHVEIQELVYEVIETKGYPDCYRKEKTITYPAFYFPSYLNPAELATTEEEYENLDCEFCYSGNESKFHEMNDIIDKLVPMIKLYLTTKFPDEAYDMILKGYLEKLSGK